MNRTVLLLGLLLAGVAPGLAQDPSTFIERARTGTAKYQDQSAAILDGYRRIGRDFPAMGEHWIRISLLFDGQIEPERPEFLTYIVVSGTPKLLGAAYALPLLPGERPPDLPAGKDAWHDHLNTIEDETLLPHHLSGNVEDRARLAMLHVWVWSPNPDGTFAADNWAIPYLRLGRTPPANAPRSAALALSLLNGGGEYFAASIAASMALDPEQRRAINAAFARAGSAVAGATGTAMEPQQWSDIWEELVKSIEASVGKNVLAHLAGTHD